MSKKAAFKAVVHGKVQGVYFRLSTLRKANAVGVTGTVRNLRNGTSVEVVAEGEEDILRKLAEYLESGPPGARVNKLDIEWTDYTGTYRTFDIVNEPG